MHIDNRWISEDTMYFHDECSENQLYLEHQHEWRTEQVERWLDLATADEITKLWNEFTGFHDPEAYIDLADILISIAFGKHHKNGHDLQKLCYNKMVPVLVKHFDVFVRMI